MARDAANARSAEVSGRGQLVSARREALGLSQEGLAHLCKVSVRTIQRVEAGENVGMSQRLIEALHRHLGMPLGELVAEKRGRARRAAP